MNAKLASNRKNYSHVVFKCPGKIWQLLKTFSKNIQRFFPEKGLHQTVNGNSLTKRKQKEKSGIKSKKKKKFEEVMIEGKIKRLRVKIYVGMLIKMDEEMKKKLANKQTKSKTILKK